MALTLKHVENKAHKAQRTRQKEVTASMIDVFLKMNEW
ncbi:hypothetical protein FM109_11215 [Vibrio casei]|nr:hypothetical protein FM109_11215 [Vibrio casei]